MKPWHKLSARAVVLSLLGWLVATNLLVWLAYAVDFWPGKAILFLSIVLLPGVALLRILRIVPKIIPVGILYSFGLGLLVLIVSGLVANQVLYMVGVTRPLELAGALGMWNAITALLIGAGALINRYPLAIIKPPLSDFTKPAWLLLGLSLLLPFVATLGAFRLNNGGDALLAQLTLCFCAGLIAYAFYLRRRLPDGLLIWLIFMIGLSILLMTSLRGWDIVGHDIEREFRVYTLTHLSGHWDIRLDRNPYNACLSITILPQMLATLLNISGLIVFKVILQVVFAACPAVLYILLRQYTSKLGALVGGMLFVCYPTFINDSAMLTRQSVAYLFFALALLVLANKIQLRQYKWLFLLCSLGAILSHYSTAYMFVALFALAVMCKFGVVWWLRRRVKPPPAYWRHSVLTPLFAISLFMMTFLWYAQATATSSGLGLTLQKSLANIPKLFSDDDNKSSDTSAALLFAGGKTQIDLYESYLKDSRSNASPGTTDEPQYHPVLTSDDLPLTPLGKQAESIGLSPSLITMLRQNFAKVLQVLALAGVLYAAYRLLTRKPDALKLDFACLSLAGLFALASLVILPVLSINYGVLRAFQQALLFLLLPITLLLARLAYYLWLWVRTTAATIGMILLFLLFTGMFAQVLGGVSPSLSMNNQGFYYGMYYSPATDFRAFTWLKQQIPKGTDVRAANFNRAFAHDPDYPFSTTGILPSQINPSTYVYLDQAQVLKQKLYAHYNSSPLIMTFPLDFYRSTKNQIYSTSSTGIYK